MQIGTIPIIYTGLFMIYDDEPMIKISRPIIYLKLKIIIVNFYRLHIPLETCPVV